MTVPQQREPELSEVDLDAQGPAADLVRVYLNGIGRTPLLTAAQEGELAKRIEAGVFAQHMLDTTDQLKPARGTELRTLVAEMFDCWMRLLPSATPMAVFGTISCSMTSSSRSISETSVMRESPSAA